jgi:hypothetical protein
MATTAITKLTATWAPSSQTGATGVADNRRRYLRSRFITIGTGRLTSAIRVSVRAMRTGT